MSDWSPSMHELFSDNNPYQETPPVFDSSKHKVVLILDSGDQPRIEISCTQEDHNENHQICPAKNCWDMVGWDAVEVTEDDFLDTLEVAELEIGYRTEGQNEDFEDFIVIKGVKS